MRSSSPLESLSTKTANSTVPRPRKSDGSLLKRIQKTDSDSTSRTSANQHKPAKRTRNRVPPPQRERILQKYTNGKNIIDISKEEQRNRETVSKIVHGPEMQEYVRAMRERFYALGPAAISAVEYALTKQKDGRLGFQLLVNIGVIPSPEEGRLLAAPQVVAGDSADQGVKEIMARLIEGVIERASALGYRAPELERDLEKVGGRINYETGKVEPLEKC